MESKKYLHDNDINAYIPDSQFRSRDPKFKDHKKKHPRPSRAKKGSTTIFAATEFTFDEQALTCICPNGKPLSLSGQVNDAKGNIAVYFIERITHCRGYPKIHQCMKNPADTTQQNGRGRQVSFSLQKQKKPTHTDWMKAR